MMEKKYTDEKNYLSVRIKWCALLAAGLIGAFLVRMWVVCIREMQSLMVPADSRRIPRAPRYSGYYYASTTFEYATVMLYGLSFQKVLL